MLPELDIHERYRVLRERLKVVIEEKKLHICPLLLDMADNNRTVHERASDDVTTEARSPITRPEVDNTSN